MHPSLKAALAIAALAIAGQAAAQITFYERAGFEGRSFSTGQKITDFRRYGFNDSASSVEVDRGLWEVCEDAGFRGKCVVVRPGKYPNLGALSLNNQVSSVRAVSSSARIEERRYAPMPVRSQVTFFEGAGFEGRSFSTAAAIQNFSGSGMNNQASSVIVAGGPWELCDGAGFQGRCVVLRPGRYSSFANTGLANRVSSARALAPGVHVDEQRYAPMPVHAQITFFERQGFLGKSFSSAGAIESFSGSGMNNQASSVIVVGGRWELCDAAGFQGRCVVLRPGRYASLGVTGLNERVSSARAIGADVRVDDQRYAPAPPVYAYQRRPEEQVFEAPVLAVRAVVGPPEQRCWVEREKVVVSQPQSNVNVPGALIGAVIGGVIGHQVGGGTGKDLATVGGAVAGAAIGANVDRGSQGQQVVTQNVQHCKNVPSQAHPEYWDVTYEFRGKEHRVQMITPPGTTVTVNGNGEPRA